MEKKNWARIEWLLFVIAIILVLGLSALFMYFENMLQGGVNFIRLLLELLNQVIPGLIGALIVVISVYIFLKSKGIDANEQFREELVGTFFHRMKTEISPKNIDSLVQKIAFYKGAGFLPLDHSKELFEFSEKLKTAKSIWINGYSCAPLFREFKTAVERALSNGTDFKIIITDPNSTAARMMEKWHSHPESVLTDIDYVAKDINAIKSAISKAKNKKAGHLEVKFIDWLPSCSMILYNPDEADGEVKIKVYPLFYSTKHSNPIEMIIDKQNYKDQFAYFYEQYDRLWNREPPKREA